MKRYITPSIEEKKSLVPNSNIAATLFGLSILTEDWEWGDELEPEDEF